MNEIPKPLPVSRSGIRTTEFWLVLLANLLIAAMTYFDQVPGVAGAVAMGLLTLVYNSLRTSIKTKLLESNETD
jgi:hypothetical protein